MGRWVNLVKASHGGAQQRCRLPVDEALSRVLVCDTSWHQFAYGYAPIVLWVHH